MTGSPASRVKGSVSLETESAGPEPATILQASGAGFEVTRVGKGPVPDR